MAFQKANDYVEVNERIVEFRNKFPDGSLQPHNPDKPFDVLDIGGKTFIVYTAAAYRSPDDTKPGIGIAQETFPGATPYTKNSEIQNAETSAWGRAIVAALAADTKRGVASAVEVRNRQAEQEAAKSNPEVADTRNAILSTAKGKGLNPAELTEIYHAQGGKGKLTATSDIDLLKRVLGAVELHGAEAAAE